MSEARRFRIITITWHEGTAGWIAVPEPNEYAISGIGVTTEEALRNMKLALSRELPDAESPLT